MTHAPADLQRDLRPVRDKRRSALHDGTCAAAHEAGQSRPTALLTFRVAAARAPEYWLDIEADAAAALSKLDAFLRDI